MSAGEGLAGRRQVLSPVLRRELVERWRGRRAFVVVTVYLVVLAAIMLLAYWVGTQILQQRTGVGAVAGAPPGVGGMPVPDGGAVAGGPLLGRFSFENLLAVVLLLVLFVTPGYAAAQISGERERRTLGLLQITLVRPWAIVAGKLGASVAWLLLLVVAALPLGAMAFFLGGVTLLDLVTGIAVVVAIAVSVAAMGLGISSLTRRTTASVVLTYGLVLTLVGGTLLAALAEAGLQRFQLEPTERPASLYANPFYGLADAVRAAPDGLTRQLPSALTPFGAILPREEQFATAPQPARGEAVVGDAVVDEPSRTGRAVWPITLAVYGLLGATGFAVATRRVRPEAGPRPRRTEPEAEQADGDRPSVARSPPRTEA